MAIKKTPPPERKQDAVAKLVQDIQDTKAFIEQVTAFFITEHPDEWREYQAALKDHERMLEDLKKAAKESGEDRVTVGNVTVSVSRSTVEYMDADAVADEAKIRGELDILLEAKVLSYSADPKNLQYLPAARRTYYQEMVEKKEGTVRVTPPKELKL